MAQIILDQEYKVITIFQIIFCANKMDRDQTSQNMGPDFFAILFYNKIILSQHAQSLI